MLMILQLMMTTLTRILVAFSLLGGCASVDDRICLEWTTHQIETTECVPMYGNMICAETVKTKHACVLYAEDEYVGTNRTAASSRNDS